MYIHIIRHGWALVRFVVVGDKSDVENDTAPELGDDESSDSSDDNEVQRTATRNSTLKLTATHCSTLRHAATHCNTLQHAETRYNGALDDDESSDSSDDDEVQRTAPRNSTLKLTATANCDILQHTATRCQRTATRYNGALDNDVSSDSSDDNAVQHLATLCSMLKLTAPHCTTLHHAATYCDILRHTAPHCATLQNTMTLCNVALDNDAKSDSSDDDAVQRTVRHNITMQRAAAHCSALQHSATHHTTLFHTATHSNTLQRYVG